MLRAYPAVITKAEGEDYGVVFPDLPGCVTTGETIGEAAAMAIEALAGHVGTMIEADEPVPEPAAPDTPLPDWLGGIAGKVIAAPVLVPVEILADRCGSTFHSTMHYSHGSIVPPRPKMEPGQDLSPVRCGSYSTSGRRNRVVGTGWRRLATPRIRHLHGSGGPGRHRRGNPGFPLARE